MTALGEVEPTRRHAEMSDVATLEPPLLAFSTGRRLAAEALGTALLPAVVIGSGIKGERLAGGNVAIALLGNTLSTGAALVVLITIFGPISDGLSGTGSADTIRASGRQRRASRAAPIGRTDDRTSTDRQLSPTSPLQRGSRPQMTMPRGGQTGPMEPVGSLDDAP